MSQQSSSPPGVGRLVATNPTDTKTREFVLLKAEATIGSDEVNDFVIRDETVSRRHAVITFNQGRLKITDLGSTNGTFVNGQRIRAATTLDKGDKVRLGGADFVLMKPAPPAVSPLPPTTAQRSAEPSRTLKPTRRWSTSIRVIAESVLVGFVLGFGAAQYLAYRLYHEQNKLILAEAEAIPVRNLEPNRATAGEATTPPDAMNRSAPVAVASASPTIERPEVNRASNTSPESASADAVLPAAMALAQLVPGSGRQAGRRAQDFTLSDLQGKPVSLSAFRGKVVFLNFWATWCGACRIYKSANQPGFAILTVNIDQQAGDGVQNFLNRNGYTFPVLVDQSNQVSSAYGVSGIPATFLIGRSGDILWDCAGGLDWSDSGLRAAIEKLIPLA
jgi:pSer/pThr/pTyr-binding forkhead associated (FHA) protein/peroxiredoxin